MFKKNLLLKFSSLMVAALISAGAPTIIHAAQGTAGGTAAPQTAPVNEWHPTRPVAGMGSIVWTNYNGNGGQLSVDLQRGNLESVREDRQDTHHFIVDWQNTYTVSPAMNNIPGRMQVNLAPGTYNYTASVPDIGTVNGTLELKAGQVEDLSFYGGEPKTIVHNHSQSHGHNTDHTFTTIVFTKLLEAEQDVTAQAR